MSTIQVDQIADRAGNNVIPVSEIRKRVSLARTSAPTSGDYLIGDIVYNSTPVAGGTIGWVCVGSGNPGTWKTFGAISA